MKDADVIVTVTSSSVPVLQAQWVKPGAHINGGWNSLSIRQFQLILITDMNIGMLNEDKKSSLIHKANQPDYH